MTTIVDSIRKHQKIIVLGVALAVITLYVVPVDQLVSAVSPPGLSNAISHIQDTRNRLAIQLAGHPDILARIDAHLLACKAI